MLVLLDCFLHVSQDLEDALGPVGRRGRALAATVNSVLPFILSLTGNCSQPLYAGTKSEEGLTFVRTEARDATPMTTKTGRE